MKRIFAWIIILLIPILYGVSIILSVMEHPIAEPFLMFSIVSSVVFPTIFYLVTIFPKHMGKIGADILDKTNSKDQKKV